LPCSFQNLDRVPLCKHSHNLCQTGYAPLILSRSQYDGLEKNSLATSFCLCKKSFRWDSEAGVKPYRIGCKTVSKPVDVGSLKVGGYVVIDGEPCKIVEFEKSKPGKHGSAKARIVAISIFTGQKKNLISPVDGKTEVPMIEKKSGQVLSISGNLLQVMDMENYQTFETPMPEDEDLKKQMTSGIEVEYWSVMGRNMVVRRKG